MKLNQLIEVSYMVTGADKAALESNKVAGSLKKVGDNLKKIRGDFSKLSGNVGALGLGGMMGGLTMSGGNRESSSILGNMAGMATGLVVFNSLLKRLPDFNTLMAARTLALDKAITKNLSGLSKTITSTSVKVGGFATKMAGMALATLGAIVVAELAANTVSRLAKNITIIEATMNILSRAVDRVYSGFNSLSVLVEANTGLPIGTRRTGIIQNKNGANFTPENLSSYLQATYERRQEELLPTFEKMEKSTLSQLTSRLLNPFGMPTTAQDKASSIAYKDMQEELKLIKEEMKLIVASQTSAVNSLLQRNRK